MSYLLRRPAMMAMAVLLSLAILNAAGPESALRVEGDVPHPLTLDAAALASLPQETAVLNQKGTKTTYRGALLYDVLTKAGVPFGKAATGKRMARYLLATGRDGYRVVLSLQEIDSAFTDTKIIIASEADGKPLPDKEQPFRLIVPQDKMRARCLFSLIKLTLVDLPANL